MENSSKGVIGAIVTGLVLVIVFFLGIKSLVKIPAGYVGVCYSVNGGVKDEVLPQGWHIKSPFVKVTKYTVALEQSYLTKGKKGDSKDNERFVASSTEGKSIGCDLAFTYQYKAEDVTGVFNRFRGQNGVAIKDSFIKPNIVSWSKEVISRYEVSDIIGSKRAEVNSELTKYIKSKFKKYGITVENVSLINVDVDAETERAINNKIKAQQDAETQAIQNKTNIDKATAENKVNVERAEAEAKVKAIKAKAEADANALINSSISDQIIKKQYIEKWDGKLPKYSGAGSNTMLQIPTN